MLLVSNEVLLRYHNPDHHVVTWSENFFSHDRQQRSKHSRTLQRSESEHEELIFPRTLPQALDTWVLKEDRLACHREDGHHRGL